MIVGRGMLARAFAESFREDPEVLIFASGVSNSGETRQEEFHRESELLAETLDSFRGSRFVYFGSCGAGNNPVSLSAYLRHKLEMEQLVVNSGGTVFRLPQVVGHTRNPNTLTNYLYDKIVRGEHFQVWTDAQRNIIDVDDVAAIAANLLQGADAVGNTYNIAAENSLGSMEIVRIFERVLGIAANYSAIAKTDLLQIDATDALLIAASLGLDLGNGYAERVIRKYYGTRSKAHPSTQA